MYYMPMPDVRSECLPGFLRAGKLGMGRSRQLLNVSVGVIRLTARGHLFIQRGALSMFLIKGVLDDYTR